MAYLRWGRIVVAGPAAGRRRRWSDRRWRQFCSWLLLPGGGAACRERGRVQLAGRRRDDGSTVLHAAAQLQRGEAEQVFHGL